MTIRYRNAVADIQSQLVQFDLADVPSGTFVPLIKLPQGAVIHTAFIDVGVIFNAGTTDVASLGTAGTPALLLSAVDIKTTGRKPATMDTIAKCLQAAGATLGVTRTGTGAAATTGQGYACVTYSVQATADSIYG